MHTNAMHIIHVYTNTLHMHTHVHTYIHICTDTYIHRDITTEISAFSSSFNTPSSSFPTANNDSIMQ